MPLSAVRDFSFLSGNKKAGIILAATIILLSAFAVASAHYIGRSVLHDSAASAAETAAAAIIRDRHIGCSQCLIAHDVQRSGLTCIVIRL